MISERAKGRFRDLVLPHLDDAYALAKWLSGSGADAEDIVQDAAIRALNALETAVIDAPRAWWLRIVRNAALTFMARNRPQRLAFVGDPADLAALEDPALSEAPPGPEQQLIDAEDGARIRNAVEALPSPLRETLVMRDMNGLSYREIADAMESPVGTVMSRLSRARAAIARSLGVRP
jgi:RNA polymerase sigma-70 factor (ECF subfamily)